MVAVSKRRRSRRGAKALGLTSLVLIATVGLAASRHPGLVKADDDIPPSRQAIIIMRALAYDANLKSRAGDTINIAVLHKKGNAGSEQMAGLMTKAFGALVATQVAGLPIVVSRIPYGGVDALKKSITGSDIDLIYACAGLEPDIDAIENVTHQMKVLTVGAKQEHVEKGLSLGVFEIEGKCTILLNLSASKQEGVAFAADLLRLARVIR
jgi:hypothetical protein